MRLHLSPFLFRSVSPTLESSAVSFWPPIRLPSASSVPLCSAFDARIGRALASFWLCVLLVCYLYCTHELMHTITIESQWSGVVVVVLFTPTGFWHIFSGPYTFKNDYAESNLEIHTKLLEWVFFENEALVAPLCWPSCILMEMVSERGHFLWHLTSIFGFPLNGV